jgi:hypothetical protein
MIHTMYNVESESLKAGESIEVRQDTDSDSRTRSATSDTDRRVRSGFEQRAVHDRSPYWILVEKEPPFRTLTLETVDDTLMLPVFSSRGEGECFLAEALHNLEGFRVRESGGGELIWLLSVPLHGVHRVALDPPAGYPPEVLDLVCLGRQVFLDRLLGRGRPWLERSRSSAHSKRLAEVV